MVTNNNNNNSNVIPTTDRQGLQTGITAPQKTFFHMNLNSGKPIQWESRKVLPLIKRLLWSKRILELPLAERLKHFSWSLDKDNTRSQNFGHTKGIENSISFKTFSVKNLFQANSETRIGKIGETGNKRNVDEGNHQKSSTVKRGVCKQLSPCKKEGWGPKASDKFEATECLYFI